MSKARWCSFWHQATLVSGSKPAQLLEVGVGNGLLRHLCGTMEIAHTSVDIAEDLSPDVVAPLQHLPFGDRTYDAACAFQVLEHMPYPLAIAGFAELCRVARRDVFLSLPNATRAYPWLVSLPLLGTIRATVPGGPWRVKKMTPSHHWEIGRAGTGLARVMSDFGRFAHPIRAFRVFENPYHHFFHFRPR